MRTDSQGFLRFYVKHNGDYNSDCSVSVGVDYGSGQQWENYTSRILGNPNGVAALTQLTGPWNADGSYTIHWQSVDPNVTEIVIQRSLNDESNYRPIARVPANATQWTDPRPPSLPNVFYTPNTTR